MAAHRLEIGTHIIRHAYEKFVTFVPRFSRSFKTDKLFLKLCNLQCKRKTEIQDGSSKQIIILILIPTDYSSLLLLLF